MWILDDLTPFQQFTPEIGQATRCTCFSRLRRCASGRGRKWRIWVTPSSTARTRRYGAQLSYFLAKEVKEPGQLVITDSQGHVVRTMKGTRQLEEGEKPPDDEDVPPPAMQARRRRGRSKRASIRQSRRRLRKRSNNRLPPKTGWETETELGKPKKYPWVPTKAGLQRVYWDLRADGPVRWESARDFNKGPKSGALVPPGEYTATMTIGGQTASQKIQVVNDPRSHGDQAGMEARYQMSQAVLHMMSQLDVALNRMDAIKAQVQALQLVAKDTPDEQAVKTASEALEKQMKAVQAADHQQPRGG